MSKETNKIIYKKIKKQIAENSTKNLCKTFESEYDAYIKYLEDKDGIISARKLDIEEAETQIELKYTENNYTLPFVGLCVSTLAIVFSIAVNIIKTNEDNLIGLVIIGIFAFLTMIIYLVFPACRIGGYQKKIAYLQFKLECIEMYRKEHEEELKQQNP